MRTRLLNSKYDLKIGKYSASVEHLKTLVSKVHKGIHRLLESDLDDTDKMNFRAVERMSSTLVFDLLQQHVPNSHGTQMYLRLAQMPTRPYLDSSLATIERVKLLWTGVFFLRIWRSTLINCKKSTLSKNFVTRNVYVSAEINVHALLLILHRIRMEDLNPEIFLPKFFGAQVCEAFFRHLRSMSTTQSTVVNFSVLEAMSKIKRIDQQNKVVTTYSDDKVHQFHIPSLEEIRAAVKDAELEALAYASLLELHSNNTFCQINEQYVSSYKEWDDFSELSSEEEINTGIHRRQRDPNFKPLRGISDDSSEMSSETD